MNDYRLALMCGVDIPLPQYQLTIHQPKIREIALIGESDFFMGAQVLCISKDKLLQGKTLLSDTSNFQIFMMVMQEKEAKDKRDAVMQVFQLLFPKSKVVTTPRSLIITQEASNPVTIDESNFDDLQEVFKCIFCTTNRANGETDYNPANKKAQEIAAKLAKAKQKINAQKNEDGVSIFSQYLSILTVGLNSMSLEDLMNLTMYQIYDLVERFGLWTSYDLDIRSRLAGAKIEKQPENWMKNLH